MSVMIESHDVDQKELDVEVAPWGYNPSSWRQRIPICLLAWGAFLMATYLALYQWRLVSDVWDPVFGGQSRAVLDSKVAARMDAWLKVPDAALGAFAYLGDAVFGLAGSTRRWQYRPWLVILFGIDVIPLGLASAVLVVLQATVVGNWCFLCLVTAAISLILVYMAYDEVHSSLRFLYLTWKRSRDRKIVWTALWGQPTSVSDAAAAEMIRKV